MYNISRTTFGLTFVSFCMGLIYTVSGNYLGLYYTFNQSDDANDLNFMLYKSQEGFINNDYILDVTWGSTGVMSILKPIIYLLGTHNFTVIIYSVFAGVLISSYVKLFDIKLNKRKTFLICFYLIGSITYIGIPGKGFLTFTAFYFFLRSIKHKSSLFFLIALIISVFNRPWEAVILVALKFILIYRKKPKQLFLFSSFVLVTFYLSLNYLLERFIFFDGLDVFIKDNIINNFGNYQFLRSDNFFFHLALTPLRILAGFMSLLTSSMSAILESNLLIDDFSYYWWRTFPVASRITSFILFTIIIFKFSIKKRLIKNFDNLEYLTFFYVLLYASLITMGGVEEKSRYFLIFPAILLPLLWTKKET